MIANRQAALGGRALTEETPCSHADRSPIFTASVGDKTYRGSMTADAFAEYYAEDGTIRGDGHTGRWRSMDDRLCFRYGDDPEACWGVIINGPAMTLLKDGEPDGSGMLIDGNPLEL